MKVHLVDNNRCTGCAACRASCHRRAISMTADSEGFLHPRIDAHLCVDCGMCDTVCPVSHPLPERKPLSVYAAQSADDELRMKSSSGGMFSLLAEKILSRKGIVFGAAFDNEWRVIHRSVEAIEELDSLRGSKYVQSDLCEVHEEVARALVSCREVMFVGTPCQVAGLLNYLKTSRIVTDNLLAVDLICHAVPSPLAWEKYLENRVKKVYPDGMAGGVGKAITRISSRRKNCGWKRFSMSLRFANDIEYLATLDEDPFLRGFLHEIYNRPSCHQCPCRDLRSGSDLTIADYWNVASRFPEMDDDKGTSLVLLNTKRGERAFEEIKELISSHQSDFEHAKFVNPAIVRPTVPHVNREQFFKHLKSKSFSRALRIAEIGRRAELKEFYYLSHPQLVNSLPMRVVRAAKHFIRRTV